MIRECDFCDERQYLNVAEIDIVEDAAGPGRRLVIWLQGCLKRCAGCYNAEFLPLRAARAVSSDAALGIVCQHASLAGVSLTGGEPLLQARALVPLMRQVRHLGLTVVCYTGYRLEELTGAGVDPALTECLAEVDLLIDGEYQRELPRDGPYRPSANQRLHFLSGRIRPEQCKEVRETTLRLAGGRASMTGTLPAAVLMRLVQGLEQWGVRLPPPR